MARAHRACLGLYLIFSFTPIVLACFNKPEAQWHKISIRVISSACQSASCGPLKWAGSCCCNETQLYFESIQFYMYILVAVFLLALGLYCLFFLICSQKKFPAVVVKSSSTPTSSVPSYAVGSPVLRRATKPSVANVKKTKRHTPQNPNLGRVIHDTPYHLGSFKPLAHALSAVAVDSSGSYVACASSDSTVRTYSLCTSKQPSRPFDASYAQCVIPSDSLTALDFGNTSGFLFGATGMLL